MQETFVQLRPKQEKFVQEFVVSLNATQAAIKAGYAKESARDAGYTLLTNPYIAQKVQEYRDKAADKSVVQLSEAIIEQKRMAFSDVRKLFHPNGVLKAMSELDDETAAAISTVEVEELYAGRGAQRVAIGRIVKVKFWSKNKAVDSIMRHLGGFEKDNRQKAPTINLNLQMANVVNMTNEDKMKLYDDMRS